MIAPALNPQSPAPGLYPGLDRATYESIAAINVSILAHFERSAMHAREAMVHPKAPTEAMEFGTAAHCALLEPARFAREYVSAPKVDRRTKEGKATWAKFEAENPGKELLEEPDFIDVVSLRDAIWAHPVAKQMLSGMGHNEVAVVWQDEETGVLCKGLIDRLSQFDGWSWILDPKSCVDASKREFSRQIKKLHYAAKAAFYLDGCNSVAPRHRRFAWLAIEKKAPYGIGIYEPDGEGLAAGRSQYRRWLRGYQTAIETGVWPGYETAVQGLGKEEVSWLI